MSPRKILAIKLRAMGDTLLMTAALAELRRAYPRAQIHVLVTATWAPLLEGHPAVDKIISYTRRRNPAARAQTLAKIALQLRREKYDVVVGFHASPSSATLAFATGAATRSVHFHGLRDRNRHSTVVIAGKGVVKPAIERDMDAVRALGLTIPEGRLPEVVLTPTEEQQGAQVLQGLGLKGPILALALGASRPTKRWPAERFAEVSAGWTTSTGGGTLVVVSEEEKPLFEELKRATAAAGTPAPVLLEPRPIRELATVLKNVRLVIGNDSGPRHLAVSVGTPTITVIGPEHPLEWHPYPVAQHPYFYIEDLACRKDALPGHPPWCSLETCTVEQHRCMRLIEAKTVLSEGKRLVGL